MILSSFIYYSHDNHSQLDHQFWWIYLFQDLECNTLLYTNIPFHIVSTNGSVQSEHLWTSNRNMPWPSTSYSNSSISIYDFDESEISTSISSFSYMKMTFQSLSYQHLILLYTCIHHSSVFHEPYHLQTSIIYQVIICIL